MRSPRTVRRAPALATCLALAGAAAPAAARAQTPTTATVVRVHVADSAGVPVPDAEVAIVRGLHDVVARGTTDAGGRRVLSAALPAGDYHVVVRKIGLARVDRFFTAGVRDTLSFDVVAQRTAQALGTVRVVEKEDLRRKSYHIDAEAIADSRQRIVDATDIVTKLRPNMIYGRQGGHVCPPLAFVWVNGTRIRLAPLDPGIVAEKRIAWEARARRVQKSIIPPKGRAAIPTHALSILASIRPEHVAEMRGTDCADLSLQRPGSTSAVFVVLKPGIAFEPGVGSYVVDAERGVAPPPPVAASPAAERLAPYRLRLLGVFDEESGTPVDSVDVVDVRTGWKTRTTDTGTASLGFLAEGANTVRLVRPGYRTLELPVTISPADTLPITVVLAKVK